MNHNKLNKVDNLNSYQDFKERKGHNSPCQSKILWKIMTLSVYSKTVPNILK